MRRQGILDVLNDVRGISPVIRCGSGSYGEVWLCQDSVGRLIALKIVSKTLLGESWEREFQGLKAYCQKIEGHTNLLNIYHIFDAGDYFCYTMEAADDFNCGHGAYMADTLSGRLRRGRMELDELKILINGILDGLETLHQAGLTHRDIKPGNILIVNGYPKIADIGLVTALDRSCTLVGTPGFIPLEVLTGEYDGIQHDLYATAKVFYCALTGNGVDSFPYFPPELLEVSVYRKLNMFIMRACSDQASLRYRSANEFRKDFDRCINNRREYFHNKFYRWSRIAIVKHQSLFVLLLGTILMFGSGFFFFFYIDVPKDTDLKPAEPLADVFLQAEKKLQTNSKPAMSQTASKTMSEIKKTEKKSSLANRIVENQRRLSELEQELAASDNTITPEKKSLLANKLDFRKRQARELARQTDYLDKVKAAKTRNYNEEINRQFYELVKQHTSSPKHNRDYNNLEGQILSRLRGGSVNPNIIVTDVSMPENNGPILGLALNKRWSNNNIFIVTLRQLYADCTPFAYQTDEFYKQLMRYGLDELEPNKSMLLHALLNNWEEEAVQLILYGAEVHTASIDGKTPLHLAAEKNLTEILSLLVFADAVIDAIDNHGNTPYILAAMTGNTQSLKLLEQAGANTQHLNYAGKKGEDFTVQGKFYQAVLQQNISLLNESLQAGANPYQLFSDHFNALQKAADWGNAEMAEALLKTHFNPEHKPANRTLTPLEIALNKGHSKVFKILLAGGADPRETTSVGDLLYQACKKARQGDEFIRMLLAEGRCNINGNNPYYDPLICYLHNKNPNPDIVKALINAGADIHFKSQADMEMPLYTAIQQKQSTRILKILLDAGANANSLCHHGGIKYSLLMLATRQRLPLDSIKLLLESGADVSFIAEDGKKAHDLTNDQRLLKLFDNPPKTQKEIMVL